MKLATACIFAILPAVASAWGPEAHSAIGVLGVEQTGTAARTQLEQILGSIEDDDIVRACNWPDAWRSMPEGEWTKSLHYVNLPPGARSYSQRRDCPDGMCLPAALGRYVGELGDASRDRQTRKEAFSFVCHYTADLHQPMHVSFAEDRGGNRVKVRYRGDRTNLHALWDSGLHYRHGRGWRSIVEDLRKRPQPSVPPFQRGDLAAWTNETYTFTLEFAYPPGCLIANKRECDVPRDWENAAWNAARNRMDMAASRLAAILDAVLLPEVSGDAEPDL